MAFEMKDRTGALFPNKRKHEDRHPDYTGECLIDGHKLQIAAWKRVSQKGLQFFAVTFREPQGMNEVAQASNSIINKLDEDSF